MGRASSNVAGALGVGAGVGVGASLGNAGGIYVCNDKNQDSFYCKFVQFFGMFKMILYICVVLAFIGYLIYWFGGFGRKMKGRGGGRR